MRVGLGGAGWWAWEIERVDLVGMAWWLLGRSGLESEGEAGWGVRLLAGITQLMCPISTGVGLFGGVCPVSTVCFGPVSTMCDLF